MTRDYRSSCKDLPEYKDTGYCVLHFPGEEKKNDFRRVLESKRARKDFDFSGTIFPEGTSNFEGARFDAETYFAGAAFIGDANFSGAQFSGQETDFSDAQFNGGQSVLQQH